MHEELIKNIRSIKQRLGIGVITTLNGTDHHLMNQLDKTEELVNKNFGLADVSGQLPPNATTDKEHKDLMKVLYPKDNSKTFRR